MDARRSTLPGLTARDVIDARPWVVLAWLAVALLAGALAVLLLAGRWQELRMAAAFLVPFLAVMLLPHGLPPLLVALNALCFLVSAAGWALDWYALHWWFDVLLHALNPFAIMASSMVMLWKAELVRARHHGRFVLLSTLLSLALGIGWELVELTFLVLTWPDTILDLVMDASGSALGGWFALWLIAARGRAPEGRRHAAASRARAPLPVRVRR